MAAEGRLYTIYYTDGTYLSYHLSDADYDKLVVQLTQDDNQVYVGLSVGILSLKDVRSIVLYREKVEGENSSASPELSEEEEKWLEAMRHAERLEREELIEDSDDVSYHGGEILP